MTHSDITYGSYLAWSISCRFRSKMSKASKQSLFESLPPETLPSLACRRRYVNPSSTSQKKVLCNSIRARSALSRFIDAMLASRDIQQGTSDFAKRVGADGADLIRDTHFKLKSCILNGGELTFDEFETAKKSGSQHGKQFLGQYLYNLK